MTNDPESIRSLADLLERTGARHKAKAWLRRLADDGDLRARSALSDLYERDGEQAAAATIWLSSAERGDHYAMWRLTGVLERAGLNEEAERWKVRAVSSRSPGTAVNGESLGQKGEEWLRRMTEAGDLVAPLALAELLTEAGRNDEADLTLREAVRGGNEFAAQALSEPQRPDAVADANAGSALRALIAALNSGRMVKDDWRFTARDADPGQ
jgi:hypothetical protein